MRTAFDMLVAEFRSMLADPAKRQQIEARIGADDTARLAQLDNTRLEAELVNAGERKAEEVLFVPNMDAPLAPKILGMRIAPSPAVAAQRRQMMFRALAPNIKDPPATDIVDVHDSFPLVDKDTGNGDVFLAGFTLAKDYEWHAHAELTVDWCIIDCSDTYYIDATAGFNYAVGLRFPIQVSGTMHFNRVSGQESADVVPSFQPINGTPDQFASSRALHRRTFSPAGAQRSQPASIRPDIRSDRSPGRHGQFWRCRRRRESCREVRTSFGRSSSHAR
jgi:hypothetical protein